MPLYDPVRGWNPLYRITNADLRSPIPLNPFESIHDEADVAIGEALTDPESDSIGYMPFTWIQNGVRITANPINFEIARAKAIRRLWATSVNALVGQWNLYQQGDMDQFRKKQLPTLFAEWRKQNYVSTADLDNAYTVNYGDRFIKFLNAFRAGKVTHKNNNLAGAEEFDPSLGRKIWNITKKVAKWMFPAVPIVATISSAAADKAKKLKKDV